VEKDESRYPLLEKDKDFVTKVLHWFTCFKEESVAIRVKFVSFGNSKTEILRF